MKSGWCLAPLIAASHDRCPRDFHNGDGSPIACECLCSHRAATAPAAPAAPPTSTARPAQLDLWGSDAA